MSLMGRALGGIGVAGGQLASKYIDEELAQRRAQFLADLQRTTANSIREDTAAFDDKRAPVLRDRAVADAIAQGGAQDTVLTNRAGNSSLNTALRTKADEDATAASDTQRRIDLQRLTDEPLNEAGRKKAAADAAAAAAASRQTVKDSAADPEFMKAQNAIKMADPEVAARIASSRAAAAAGYASAAHSNAGTEGIKLANEDKRRLGALYDDMTATLYDEALTDERRAKAMQKIGTQIQAIKAKNGQAASREPELDTQTVTEEKMNPDGTTTKTTRKEVRRPGQATTKEEGDPIKAAMDAERAKRAAKSEGNASAPPTAQPAGRSAPPAPDAMTTAIMDDLQPLATKYQEAKKMLQAAAKSQDANSVSHYAKQLTVATEALRKEAESRLGNNADKFLNGIL